MDHIHNGQYQLLQKDPSSKIKVKKLKKLQALKVNRFIDTKIHYYLKSTDSPDLPSTKNKQARSSYTTYYYYFM